MYIQFKAKFVIRLSSILFFFAATQQDPFVMRRQQQTVQLTRPHSNASDTSFYPGSVPQPSPAGSGDSNVNPRTPMSNNPLTPQSMQPSTPQSGLGHGGQNVPSGGGAPLSQIHQSIGIMQDSEFLSVDPLRSSPVPDDQSHLQYLNTLVPSTQVSKSQLLKSNVGFQQQTPVMQGKLTNICTCIVH